MSEPKQFLVLLLQPIIPLPLLPLAILRLLIHDQDSRAYERRAEGAEIDRVAGNVARSGMNQY